MIAALFIHPIEMSFDSQLWLLLPLCVAVGIVYKTIRIRDLRFLWREVAILMAYMVAGLATLGAVLWLIADYWPM